MPPISLGMGCAVTQLGTVFSPLSLSPALWLDAADQSTMYQERTGASATTLVASDADPVGTWKDKSGNGKHFTASSDAVRPTYKIAVQNNQSIVRMDGVDDYLSSSASIAGVRTVIFLVKYRNSTHTGNYLGYFGPAAFGASDYIASSAPGGTSFASVAPASTYYRNGTQMLETANGAGPMNAFTICIFTSTSSAWTTNPFLIGRDRMIGGYTVTDWCELILFDSVLSASQRQQVERYLSSKWGVTLS